MAGRRAVGLQVTAICALMLVGAACLEAAGPWVGPAAGIRVGVAGDSQVQAAQYGPGPKEQDDPDHHITDDLNAAGYQASVAGTIGSNTRDLVNWRAGPEPGPQTTVLAYGANDMNTSATGQPAIPIAEAESNPGHHRRCGGAVVRPDRGQPRVPGVGPSARDDRG
jgi:hypothetical protein